MTTELINALGEAAIRIGAAILIASASLAVAYIQRFATERLNMVNTSAALEELDNSIEVIVGELQQTVVEGLKAASADGKLSREDVIMLHGLLTKKVEQRLSSHAKDIISGAGIDISSYVLSNGESIVNRNKQRSA